MSISNPQAQSLGTAIDLNADLGEGSPFDEAILAIVSSANISCGAHAGDDHSILQAITFAKANRVVIGAHPSYPDKANMGRVSLPMSKSALQQSLVEQLSYLQRIAKQAGSDVRYVKAHGALYNDMAKDRNLAEQFCQCIDAFDASLAIMGLAGSAIADVCRTQGKVFIAEAFIDRRYHPDGTLVSRTQPGAILDHPPEAVKQALQLIQQQSVITLSGAPVPIQADSLCLHGDTPAALTIAEQLKAALHQRAINIRAMR